MKGMMELVDIQGHQGDYPDVSRLKFELIIFFKENPGVIDSADMISARLGRSPVEVEQALDESGQQGHLPQGVAGHHLSRLLLPAIHGVPAQNKRGRAGPLLQFPHGAAQYLLCARTRLSGIKAE